MAKERTKRPAQGEAQGARTSATKARPTEAKQPAVVAKPRAKSKPVTAPSKAAVKPPPAKPPAAKPPASKRPAARRAPSPREATVHTPSVIPVPVLEEAAFGPPGITIDADDVETMAVDAPQFEPGLVEDRKSNV